MILVILILITTLLVILALAFRNGLESALPFCAFMAVVSPLECSIPIPGLFDLNVHRLMLILLLILFLAKGGKSNSRHYASKSLGILIVLHIIWISISTANSVEPASSIKMMLSMVLEYYVLYYILVRTISSTKTIRKILFGMVLGVMACSVCGAFEAYTGWSVLSYFPVRVHNFHGGEVLDVDEQRGLRVRATFPHAILYGEAIAMAILWALYLLATTKDRWKSILLWGGVMLMFLNIFKTASRGPWSALAFSLVLLLSFTFTKVRKYLLFIVILSVSVCVIRPGVWDSIRAIYDSTFDPTSVAGSSYEYRWALLKVGEQALAKDGARKVWGYGLETFFDLHLQGEFLGVPDHKFESCDSSWVQLMVETGYVGLLLIAGLLLNPLLAALRDVRRLPKPHAYLSWIFVISMISFYYLMTNVAIYGWGQPGYMLWIVIAMSAVYPRLVKDQYGIRARSRVPSHEAGTLQAGVCVESPDVELVL